MLTFFYRRGNILKLVNKVETASKTNKEALFLFWPQLCMCTRVHSAYTWCDSCAHVAEMVYLLIETKPLAPLSDLCPP